MYEIGQFVHKHYRITGLLPKAPYGARFVASARGPQLMLWAIGAPFIRHKADQDRLIERLSRFYKVRHPNLPQLLDLFVEGREVVMVHQLVSGMDLAGEIARRRGPLQPDEARVAIAHLCSAVSQCHQLGIVVGDLWPGGVCFQPEGTMLLATGAGVHASPRLMSTAMIDARSGDYVAPELRLWGRGDVRADVWSLGALAHLMVYGEPYGWSDGVARGLFASVGRWLRFGSRRVRPAARHPAVDQALRRALSPDPDRRQPNPETLYEELARALHAVAAAPPPAPDPAARRVYAAGFAPADRPTAVPQLAPPPAAGAVATAAPDHATLAAGMPAVSDAPVPAPEPAPAHQTLSIDVDLADFNKTRQLDANEVNALLEADRADAQKNSTTQVDADEIELSKRSRDS